MAARAIQKSEYDKSGANSLPISRTQSEVTGDSETASEIFARFEDVREEILKSHGSLDSDKFLQPDPSLATSLVKPAGLNSSYDARSTIERGKITNVKSQLGDNLNFLTGRSRSNSGIYKESMYVNKQQTDENDTSETKETGEVEPLKAETDLHTDPSPTASYKRRKVEAMKSKIKVVDIDYGEFEKSRSSRPQTDASQIDLNLEKRRSAHAHDDEHVDFTANLKQTHVEPRQSVEHTKIEPYELKHVSESTKSSGENQQRTSASLEKVTIQKSGRIKATTAAHHTNLAEVEQATDLNEVKLKKVESVKRSEVESSATGPPGVFAGELQAAMRSLKRTPSTPAGETTVADTDEPDIDETKGKVKGIKNLFEKQGFNPFGGRANQNQSRTSTSTTKTTTVKESVSRQPSKMPNEQETAIMNPMFKPATSPKVENEPQPLTEVFSSDRREVVAPPPSFADSLPRQEESITQVNRQTSELFDVNNAATLELPRRAVKTEVNSSSTLQPPPLDSRSQRSVSPASCIEDQTMTFTDDIDIDSPIEAKTSEYVNANGSIEVNGSTNEPATYEQITSYSEHATIDKVDGNIEYSPQDTQERKYESKKPLSLARETSNKSARSKAFAKVKEDKKLDPDINLGANEGTRSLRLAYKQRGALSVPDIYIDPHDPGTVFKDNTSYRDPLETYEKSKMTKSTDSFKSIERRKESIEDILGEAADNTDRVDGTEVEKIAVISDAGYSSYTGSMEQTRAAQNMKPLSLTDESDDSDEVKLQGRYIKKQASITGGDAPVRYRMKRQQHHKYHGSDAEDSVTSGLSDAFSSVSEQALYVEDGRNVIVAHVPNRGSSSRRHRHREFSTGSCVSVVAVGGPPQITSGPASAHTSRQVRRKRLISAEEEWYFRTLNQSSNGSSVISGFNRGRPQRTQSETEIHLIASEEPDIYSTDELESVYSSHSLPRIITEEVVEVHRLPKHHSSKRHASNYYSHQRKSHGLHQVRKMHRSQPRRYPSEPHLHQNYETDNRQTSHYTSWTSYNTAPQQHFSSNRVRTQGITAPRGVQPTAQQTFIPKQTQVYHQPRQRGLSSTWRVDGSNVQPVQRRATLNSEGLSPLSPVSPVRSNQNGVFRQLSTNQPRMGTRQAYAKSVNTNKAGVGGRGKGGVTVKVGQGATSSTSSNAMRSRNFASGGPAASSSFRSEPGDPRRSTNYHVAEQMTSHTLGGVTNANRVGTASGGYGVRSAYGQTSSIATTPLSLYDSVVY